MAEGFLEHLVNDAEIHSLFWLWFKTSLTEVLL